LHDASQPVNDRVPDPVPHFSSARARGPAWVPATLPSRAICVAGLAISAPAAHAVRPLAAASAPALPGGPEGVGWGEVAASVGQPDRPAGAVLDAGYPAAVDFSSEALPAFLAAQGRALRMLPAAESACGRSCHAAGNDNARCGAYAAAPPGGDTDLLHTAAGKRAAGRGLEQSRAAICPIRVDAAPIEGPTAHPSGAAHSAATRGSTQEAAGSSAPERAAAPARWA
jgi:hypothetical protein